jgi:hypothetical protein
MNKRIQLQKWVIELLDGVLPFLQTVEARQSCSPLVVCIHTGLVCEANAVVAESDVYTPVPKVEKIDLKTHA